jgi:hypothetical protein
MDNYVAYPSRIRFSGSLTFPATDYQSYTIHSVLAGLNKGLAIAFRLFSSSLYLATIPDSDNIREYHIQTSQVMLTE